MNIALRQPFAPMEALSVDEIPEGKNWQYEPKWDGFRCLVFRDGARIALQSKSGQPLTRYFPELVKAIASLKARRCVLDGEIVVPRGRVFSFDDLLQRIHPAASRVNKLAAETPALLIVFDLLVDAAGKTLTKQHLPERRERLEAFARKFLRGRKSIRLSPATVKIAEAKKWL
jgi:ATP-dependent DNA ligase